MPPRETPPEPNVPSLKKWRPTLAEQETTIARSRRSTCSRRSAPSRTKLTRKGYHADKASMVYGEEVGWFYTVPLTEFRWTVGRLKPAAFSPEAQAARLRGSRRPQNSPEKVQESSDG
jgi:hypothetical protein